jgi:hypothetical protein
LTIRFSGDVTSLPDGEGYVEARIRRATTPCAATERDEPLRKLGGTARGARGHRRGRPPGCRVAPMRAVGGRRQIRDVRARDVSCPSARALARRWGRG